ncbi:Variant surface glycoprotein [Trypanosoma congolense IL3000]|uniref:Variant surface glycoprotein n=1 Tax=Trypanosoma congolense (strain IL3000) TaxID=1068625 RepID=F9WAA6_TRYCI|nr:Variant surface glycoprotein [Trypanosoma congolense IL3000]
MEVWKRMLLFLFLVESVNATPGYNKEVFDKLCEITRRASSSLSSARSNAVANKSLYEAIYGTVDSAQFAENGDIFLGTACGIYSHGRGEVCSYKSGVLGGSGKNGCFADSLFGTFLCVCTNGHREDKDLCGIGEVGGGELWSGWGGQGLGEKTELFKKVWEKIKEICTDKTGRKLGGEVQLDFLKTSVDNLRRSLNHHNSVYFYLGGIGASHCTGVISGDACVAYKESVTGTANILWADKINEAIESLKTVRSKAKKSASLAGITGSPAANMVPGENVVLEERNEPASHKTNDQQESEITQTQTATTAGHSEGEKSRGKRSTQISQETEISPLTLEHEEGSPTTKPQWLLMAALLI